MKTKAQQAIEALRSRTAGLALSSLSVRADGKLVASEDNRTIRGYAVVWGVVDSYGTVFKRGAFTKSIQERGPDSQSKYKIVLLWQHRMDDPIGRVTVLREDDYGLYFEAELDKDVASADRALSQVRSGTINQFSIGFNYVWEMLDYNAELDVIEVREAALFEISPVTIASNMETFALRSADNRDTALADLNAEAEEFIRTIPRDKQLELRHIFACYVSLCAKGPQEVRRPAPLEAEPDAAGLDYNYLLNNLKL